MEGQSDPPRAEVTLQLHQLWGLHLNPVSKAEELCELWFSHWEDGNGNSIRGLL